MLVGEKFTGLFMSTMVFFIPIVIFNKINLLKKFISFKFIFLLSIFCLLLFLSIYLSYSAISGEDRALDRFLERLALQSQLWWALDGLTTMSMQPVHLIKENLLGIGQTERFMQGIFYVMYLVSPDFVYDRFTEQGINMTMGGPINLAYFFGYPISVVVCLAIGGLLGMIYYILYKTILLKDVLFILLAIKGLDGIYRAVVMGDVFYLLSAKVYLTIIIFVVYTFLSYYFHYRNKIS